MLTDKFNLLPENDLAEKQQRVRHFMKENGLDSVFIADNGNKYYLTGRIFSGYIIVTASNMYCFLKRPTCFNGNEVMLIRKVENISELIDVTKLGRIGFELSQSPYNDVMRHAKAMHATDFGNADCVMMAARAIKTPYEIRKIRTSSEALSAVYRTITDLYRPGMSDVELQVEIERQSRLRGNLGIFRIIGQEMELNMGSVLAGENADNPSPYDFAMGGSGIDPSLPVGADGTIIRPGMTVMVDTNGDFTGYMTDMTRTFACGEVGEEAHRAHRLSIDICNAIAQAGKPGVRAADLYNLAITMVTDAGLADRFMGHNSQAGFVGHGVGIAINEAPVIAPRSRDILALNNVIALEPKFVIDGVGAVGIENTYVVTESGMLKLTDAPQDMLQLND